MLHIGCHLSSAEGFLRMGHDALTIGADTFQFFTRNPRGGAAKPIDPDDVKAFLEFQKEHAFAPLVAHAPYTLNPCGADERVRTFAREVLADDLVRMEYLPGNFYNLHPGSHVGQGTEAGIAQTSALLNEVMSAGMKTTILLETMSGKGSEIGRSFEEIAELLSRLKYPERAGVCLDTCHIFCAGYDIVHDTDGVLADFDRLIGLRHLRAVHLNDSMMEFASHKDRHACIGDGRIGYETLHEFVRNPAVRDLPFILETPQDSLAGYADEIAHLRA